MFLMLNFQIGDRAHVKINQNFKLGLPFLWKKVNKKLWPLFMDGVQLPQGYRATKGREFTFQY